MEQILYLIISMPKTPRQADIFSFSGALVTILRPKH